MLEELGHGHPQHAGLARLVVDLGDDRDLAQPQRLAALACLAHRDLVRLDDGGRVGQHAAAFEEELVGVVERRQGGAEIAFSRRVHVGGETVRRRRPTGHVGREEGKDGED